MTLLISLIFLIVMSLGAFFAHRGMVLDQNVTGNYYRSTRALMAAEAGLEIMAARLRDYTQRELILTQTADGTKYDGFQTGASVYRPTSAHLGTVRATATGQVTALVTLSAVGVAPDDDPFDKLRVDSIGCWDDGTDASCATCSADCPTTAQVSQILAFVGGLSGVPSAPLTTKGAADLDGSAIRVTNTDPEMNGLTIHAGGTIDALATNLITLPGTPPMASIAPNDSELSTISTDAYFEKFFGKDKATYRENADEIIVCGGVCNTSVNGKTGRIIWVDLPAGASSFQLNSNTTVGTTSAPVILVVNGPVELNGDATIYGVVYSASILWNNIGGGTASVIGAAIAEGDFTANGTPNPVYDAGVLKRLSGRIGGYVKIPGSWRDF